MLIRRIYYALKPYLPWNVRIALRRFWAKRLLKSNAAVWPIDSSAATVPPGWPGWPDGKKFAVVLTHDVEGPEGLARCRELAEREMELGFRSCFNFIPEGSYVVPPELRAWLAANGFEVGVHDLEHDGHLFSSARSFGKKAVRINRYLQEWQAEGFRAGFMLRNLDWLHQLDIQYDCSTFDTDPFEPQPDAANTIYPFWVPAPSTSDVTAKGYVELPYTLPQDSTLFMLHREKTNDIWRAKLDWVAGHGGMVLLNVHPDYLHLGPGNGAQGPTVLEHYVDLLRHLQKNHAGNFWHVLPRRLAAFVRGWQGQPTLPPKRQPTS